MDEANTLKSTCAGTSAICTSIKRERKAEQPPKLYDLTTLQREANRLFGFTAKQTLDYAQQLYEKKLLTYPRTDSQYLTRVKRRCLNRVFCGFMHRYVEPGVRTSLHDFFCRRRPAK